MKATISYRLSDSTVLSIQSGNNPTGEECVKELANATHELEKYVVPEGYFDRFAVVGNKLAATKPLYAIATEHKQVN